MLRQYHGDRQERSNLGLASQLMALLQGHSGLVYLQVCDSQIHLTLCHIVRLKWYLTDKQ